MTDDPTIEEAVAIARSRALQPGLGGGSVIVDRRVLRTLLASYASLVESRKEAKRLMRPFVAVSEDYAEHYGGIDPDTILIGRVPWNAKGDGPPPCVTGAEVIALAAFVSNEKES